MVSYPSVNLIDSIIDEVALEGLDGITLEALWTRLAQRYHDQLPLSRNLMTQVWSICVKVKDFAFYELEVPRDPLILFDRYEFVDPDTGIILEPENVPKDIYPHNPITDPATGNRGSCSMYYSRKNIRNAARNCSLDEAINKYGQKLVIMASQSVRERTLFGDAVCPMLELNIMQYCFLERVGRARYDGEITQGKLSLSALNEFPKSLFYHRKYLLRHKLITKQPYHQKSAGHSYSGSLLHLPRFYVERKPKVIFLAERIVDLLKTKKDCMAEYDEIKTQLHLQNVIKKLCKMSFFQRVIKTDTRVPYRMLYPNADAKEWQLKNYPNKEKMIRVFQLVDPNMDSSELWSKDEPQEDDIPFEVDVSNHKFNVPFLKQANAAIEACEHDGVCQQTLSKNMGLTKLQSRTILRNLVKANLVATYMNDIGRQRVTKYVSKKFEKGSEMSKQFKQEVDKIKEFSKSMKTGTDKGVTNEPSRVDLALSVDTRDKTDVRRGARAVAETDKQPTAPSSVLCKTFYVVNRILYKYRISRRPNRYKCTSLRLTKEPATNASTTDSSKKSDSTVLATMLSNDLKASSLHKCIKANLTTQLPDSTKKSKLEMLGFMQDVKNIEENNALGVTYRLLRRANMIIESVKEHQVIDNITKLWKLINEEEDKEGYDVKIDKKSLLRLLEKLAMDNLIKNITLTLTANGRQKNLTFICDPNIDVNHSIIQSAVERAKVKFCLSEIHRSKSSSRGPPQKPDDSKTAGTKVRKWYGFVPKCIRMKTIHVLLYYLVYDHPGEPTVSKSEQIRALRSNGYDIPDSLVEESGTIYYPEIGWRMFIPPLANHVGWPRGWMLMFDILLRLPLSIFVKVHDIKTVVPDLDGYLNHPIRRHYLVNDLPAEIRRVLFFKRKYIFDIHETITRLCYVGLAQFGPQKLKEKDQVFVYVNRHAELMDTTSSAPGYHKIEDRVYPVTRYTFDEAADVEKYWYDMWNICANTPLGGRLAVQGKNILLEDIREKAEMIEAVSARTADEAVRMDTGTMPGDRQGAAGIDSAFFAHLKRNWYWSNVDGSSKKAADSQSVTRERSAYLSKLKTRPVKFVEFSGLKRASGPVAVTTRDLRKKAQQQQQQPQLQQPRKPSVATKGGKRKQAAAAPRRSMKPKSFVRKVMPMVRTRKARVKYDEMDYHALRHMQKLRVDWEPHEDNLLLVCKVAMTYLYPNSRKQLISFSTVRDVLQSYSFSSHNKTAPACQRRLLYMLKQPQTVKSVRIGVEEIMQSYFIEKRFGGITNRIKEQHKDLDEQEKRLAQVFKELVAYIASKYYDISDVAGKEPVPLPRTVQQFNVLYEIVHPRRLDNAGFVDDVRSVADVHAATLNSVIHSSMCCGKDKRSWAYQFFMVYQQYPEALLRSAMVKIRKDQIVTVKKRHSSAIKSKGNYMPMSNSQYELSTYYTHRLQTKWPYDIFAESYDVFVKLLKWYNEWDWKTSSDREGLEISPVTGGTVATIQDYLPQDQLDFDIEIPDQVIMLDPRLTEKDETYLRIARRYQDILVSLDNSGADEENPLDVKSRGRPEENKKRRSTGHEDRNDETRSVVDSPDRVVSLEGREENAEGPPCKRTRLSPAPSNETRDKNSAHNAEGVAKASKESGVPPSKKPRVDDQAGESCDPTSAGETSRSTEVRDSTHTERQAGLNAGPQAPSIDKMNANRNDNQDTKDTGAHGFKDVHEYVYTRVSDMIRNAELARNRPKANKSSVDTHEVRKRQSRLALLKMRDELSGLSVADSQHAHEYFAVNMFKIIYRLQPTDPGYRKDVAGLKGYANPSELLPASLRIAKELVHRIGKLATFPRDVVPYDEYKRSLPSSFCDSDKIDRVYGFVVERKELGATIRELAERCEADLGRDDLRRVLSSLTDNSIVLRTGVTTPRYVHHAYADPWLVHSYKVNRLERESMAPAPKGSVYAIEGDDASFKGISDGKEASGERANSEGTSGQPSNDNDEEHEPAERKLPRRPITLPVPLSDAQLTPRTMEPGAAEEIQVISRPWVRIDGMVNRRVLDRMLGAVLAYCLTHPGVSLARVQNRFVPILQPFHTRELVEMLVSLECLQWRFVRKTRVTLFSKPTTVRPETDDICAAEEDTFVEPLMGAITKFSVFLSTKTYNVDYIL